MKTFPVFCSSFSTTYDLEHSNTARYIYDHIISDPGVRARMVLASEFRLPALSVCAKEIERICAQPGSDLVLQDKVKQGIGRMVSESMLGLGYTKDTSKKGCRLSAELGLEYFKNAAVYKRDGKVRPEVLMEIVLSGGTEYHETLNA